MINLKGHKGITLIALVITIIVLLILAGITISQIASQDSAPNKAAEAKVENDKGAMKDTANLVTTKYIQEFYEKKYVENDPNFTYVDQGEYAEAQFATEDEGGYTYSVSSHKLTVTDANGNSVTGTINSNGTIIWDGSSSGGMAQTNIKVGNDIIDLSTLDETTVGQYYGTEIVTINNVKYGLYYVDYDGDFGDEGTVYLKALTGVRSTALNRGITNADADTQTAQRTEAVRIMKELNPDWALNRGTTTYDSMQNNEKGVAYLCNPSNSNWSGIQTAFETQYGASNVNYVVGAPSSEMLAKAINQAGGLSGNEALDSRWFDARSTTDITKKSPYTYSGYLYSITGRNTTDNTGYGYMAQSTAQQNALTTAQKAMYYSNTNQWLASPASRGYDIFVCLVTSRSNLSLNDWGGSLAACPLVSLKSGVNLVPASN